MAVTGTRHDPIRGFKYKITLTGPHPIGVFQLGAQRVSGLKSKTEAVKYRDGDDYDGEYTFVGPTTYNNVTLERGVRPAGAEAAEQLMEWCQLIQEAAREGAGDEIDVYGSMMIEVFRRNMAEFTLSSTRRSYPEVTYYFEGVWPASYGHSDLDGTSSAVWMETVEFATKTRSVTYEGS